MVSKFGKFRDFIPGEQAGKAVERELLGVVKEIKEKRSDKSETHKIIKEGKILSDFEIAIKVIKERQTQNIINPSRPFANFVRSKVFDLLGLKNDKDLKFYTALSADPNKETMLDKDFGIDAFFELDQKEKETLIVSVDLTLKPLKDNPKATITFHIPDDFPIQARFEKNKIEGLTEVEWQTFDKVTDDLAHQIAEKFKKLNIVNLEKKD